MKLFNLSTLGSADPDLVMLEEEPEALGLEAHRAAVGKSIAGAWPADATMQLPEENPGMRLTSLLGNTFNYLIVEPAVVAVIAAHCSGVPIERLPFTLLDHRGRVHSRDYLVLNPLGDWDALDLAASEIVFVGTQIARITKLVLDPEKSSAAPALFRLAQQRQLLVINEALADALRPFTNMVLRRIPVSAGKAP